MASAAIKYLPAPFQETDTEHIMVVKQLVNCFPGLTESEHEERVWPAAFVCSGAGAKGKGIARECLTQAVTGSGGSTMGMLSSSKERPKGSPGLSCLSLCLRLSHPG